MQPVVRSGKFYAGADLCCGENVVIDVVDEVIVGDRCVLPDNAYLGGRRIVIGDDFYGYSWEWRRLDIGRGRRDEEEAVLTVGNRCTFHDSRIDLARRVTIGSDVGLSPEVVIYTHGYWQSPLEGFPCQYEPVEVKSGAIIGFCSTLLPGAVVGERAVVAAGAVVSGVLRADAVHGGVPARFIRDIESLSFSEKLSVFQEVADAYQASSIYRNIPLIVVDYPWLYLPGCSVNVETCSVRGLEDERSDDLRDFLFKHGIRIYTKRPFRKLSKR
jgi:acetyltransferase-like isoleucine patch superfamily enzyme